MKIGYFITVRLKSTRLKNKVLLDLNGKSVIDRVIERCKMVNGIDGIVLCTSTNSQDSILFNNALNAKIQFYAGSEDDVLERLLNAAKYYNYDAFVSITADNPLFSIYLSELTIDMYKKENSDFIFTKGLPIGCCPYLLKTQTLEIVNLIKKDKDTEIWGSLVHQPDYFSIGEIIVTNCNYKEKRLTCDYPNDYKLLRAIYSNYYPSSIPRVQDVFDLFDNKPYLLEINSIHKQKQLSNEKFCEIANLFKTKKDKVFEFAEKMNITLCPGLKTWEIEI